MEVHVFQQHVPVQLRTVAGPAGSRGRGEGEEGSGITSTLVAARWLRDAELPCGEGQQEDSQSGQDNTEYLRQIITCTLPD